ncbi:MAG: hypothetical protein KJ063_07430 [Anaerolineae bacterium]|nr:hypothetical protein [Anaerolineae bacterium]
MQLSLVKNLGLHDLRLVRRDSFLVGMTALAVVDALLVRWITPLATEWLAPRMDLTPYYPLIVSYMVLLVAPVLLGTVFGFLLIEEKDENTLVALQVTPLPMRGFLLYRMGIAMALSFVIVMISLPLTGLVSLSGPLLLVVLSTAPIAPLIAILYATFAENKVQGFGFLKAIGTLNIIPIAAYFVGLPWQYLIGVVYPFYWPVKAYWEMDNPIYLLYVGISFLVHFGLISWLLRRFERENGRAEG